MQTRDVSSKIIQLMTQKLYALLPNHYKQVLRALLNVFGNLKYIDGNGNLLQVKCSTGKPERNKGKDNVDNTLILPYITISERGTSNDDEKRRYLPILVNEVEWDAEEKRAKRWLSLSPRPIIITYDINIWSKYLEDLDLLRSNIFHLFNPDLELRTEDNDFIKAFLISESNIEAEEQPDTKDRVIKKKITIEVETYLRSPRILFTNTSEIDNMIFPVGIAKGDCDI